MAEVLSEWPAGLRQKSRFVKFLDGQIWKVSADEMRASEGVFRAGLSRAATKQGLVACCYRLGDSFIVQALPRESKNGHS
jgi:hypothetical protein